MNGKLLVGMKKSNLLAGEFVCSCFCGILSSLSDRLGCTRGRVIERFNLGQRESRPRQFRRKRAAYLYRPSRAVSTTRYEWARRSHFTSRPNASRSVMRSFVTQNGQIKFQPRQ